MIDLDIRVDKATLDRAQNLLKGIKNGYPRALTTAINTTLTTVKVQTKARIGSEVNLKASRIEQDLTLKKANYGKPNGSLIARGEPVGLINFAARQTQKGVSVKVLRSSSRTLLKHAFIAKGRGRSQGKDGNLKKHIWWRDRSKMPAPKKLVTGKAARVAWGAINEKYRFPIHRLTGPRIEDIMGKDSVLTPIIIQGNFLFLSNLEKKIVEIFRKHHG